MERTVTMPAELNAEALADLKGWLGITRPQEDTLLTDLLKASADLCEAFTGQAPLEQEVEETILCAAGHYVLSSRPVRTLVSAESVSEAGVRTTLETQDYDFETDTSLRACFALRRTVDGQSVRVSLRTGIASDWQALPGALKQGIIRLAAFHYRDRDAGKEGGPPASVAALWRPWRVIRLA